VTPQPGFGPGMNVLDLELFHNYSTKTCLTQTSHHDSVKEFHKHGLIIEALKSTYSIHCLLAFSAFHLVEQYHQLLKTASPQEIPVLRAKQDQYLVAATSYHNSGISAFREDLVKITEANCENLLVASTLIIGISFAELCDGVRLSSPSSKGSGDVSRWPVTRWHVLIRGVKTVLEGSWQWLQYGPLAVFLSKPRTMEDIESSIAGVDPDVTLWLDRLCFTFTRHSEPEVSRVCIAAIELMRKTWGAVASGLDLAVAFFWAALVEDEFMALLDAGQSEALLVLGAYCVLIHKMEWYWWIRGWPRNMLRIIEGLVDEKWKSWLEWPVEMVENADQVQLKDGFLIVTEGKCCG
jgi:hypothetical protein